MSKYYSINELEEQTGVPGSTIRRYIQKFPDFFVVTGGARGKRYEETAIKVLIRIKGLFEDGYETEGVDKVLRDEFPTVVTVGDNVENDKQNNAPTLATADDIAEIKDALKRQEEFNRLLVEKLDNQERYIRESLEKRDQQLTQQMNLLLETKKETAATDEKESKGFLARLFKR